MSLNQNRAICVLLLILFPCLAAADGSTAYGFALYYGLVLLFWAALAVIYALIGRYLFLITRTNEKRTVMNMLAIAFLFLPLICVIYLLLSMFI